MVIIKGSNNINLYNASYLLTYMEIDKLTIFLINKKDKSMTHNIIDKGSPITYVEVNPKDFIKLIASTFDFLEYNNNCLYILKDGSYFDIKSLITNISRYKVNIGRGGGQKAHLLSPLDFRLSAYLMAMFNLDYNYIKDINIYNIISKDRYLSYLGKPKHPTNIVRRVKYD